MTIADSHSDGISPFGCWRCPANVAARSGDNPAGGCPVIGEGIAIGVAGNTTDGAAVPRCHVGGTGGEAGDGRWGIDYLNIAAIGDSGGFTVADSHSDGIGSLSCRRCPGNRTACS